MRTADPRTGIEVVDPQECLRLLATQSIGRIAVSHGGRIICVPVNYVLDADRVIFRTAAGTKLDAAIRGAQVAFEVDSADAVAQSGWSVMVSGRAEEVIHPDELARLRSLPLRPWVPTEVGHLIVVHPESITGRRVRAPQLGSVADPPPRSRPRA